MKRTLVTSLMAAWATVLAAAGIAQDQTEQNPEKGQQTQAQQQTQQGQDQQESEQAQREEYQQQQQEQQAQREQYEDQQARGNNGQNQQQAQGVQSEDAQPRQQAEQEQKQQAQGQQAQGQPDPDEPLPEYEAGASVILSGTIASMGEEQFTLDYGDDQVTVDLEGWNWAEELNEHLSEGQQVTVSGTVDDDWFEERSIDADNIYVTTDSAYYYIVDDNPAYSAQQSERESQRDGTFISTRGEVTEIADDQLTLESNGNTIQVDLSELGYDPLDEEGAQQIKQGDRVYVFGDIDENFFESGTISAESLISLSEQGQPQGPIEQMEQPGIERPGQRSGEQDIQEPGEPQPRQGVQPQTPGREQQD